MDGAAAAVLTTVTVTGSTDSYYFKSSVSSKYLFGTYMWPGFVKLDWCPTASTACDGAEM